MHPYNKDLAVVTLANAHPPQLVRFAEAKPYVPLPLTTTVPENGEPSDPYSLLWTPCGPPMWTPNVDPQCGPKCGPPVDILCRAPPPHHHRHREQ
eukprot:8894628-Pyramimonas_sp.AAC.1